MHPIKEVQLGTFVMLANPIMEEKPKAISSSHFKGSIGVVSNSKASLVLIAL